MSNEPFTLVPPSILRLNPLTGFFRALEQLREVTDRLVA